MAMEEEEASQCLDGGLDGWREASVTKPRPHLS